MSLSFALYTVHNVLETPLGRLVLEHPASAPQVYLIGYATVRSLCLPFQRLL